MKELTRRGFLRTIAFIGGLFGSKLAAAPARWTRSVQVRSASAFYGPFMIDQLTAGTRLDVVWKHGWALVALDGYLLGRLPAEVARALRQPERGKPLTVKIERIGKDSQGRLSLFVWLQ